MSTDSAPVELLVNDLGVLNLVVLLKMRLETFPSITDLEAALFFAIPGFELGVLTTLMPLPVVLAAKCPVAIIVSAAIWSIVPPLMFPGDGSAMLARKTRDFFAYFNSQGLLNILSHSGHFWSLASAPP